MKRLLPLLLCTLAVAAPTSKTPLEPLLTTLSKTSGLSTFYSIFNGTGGGLGKPGPDFEERFNIPDVSLNFTLFAPTDEALAHISTGLLSGLTSPQSYQLLKAILNTHFATGYLSDADLEGGLTVKAIEGYTLTFDSDGGITTNAATLNKSIPAEAHLIRNADGNPACTPASNGRICKIDNILDGFRTYFGQDAARESADDLPPVTFSPGTMKDIIQNNNELTTLASALKEINPGFLTRLSLSSEEYENTTVYLAPSNAAFDSLSADPYPSLVQPSNADLSDSLLRFGFGRLEDQEILRSERGFNITLTGGRAGNALITERICADSGNGCVWVIGRLLDPLFGA